MSTRDALDFPDHDRIWLESSLPPDQPPKSSQRPFVTLTFATSLDSALSLAPGTQTALSGPQSKAVTHFLRSRHDAILVGVGTVLADDPSLNCRLSGVGGYGGNALDGQPRPIVLDPQARWDVGASKVLGLARQHRGKTPWVVCTVRPDEARRAMLEQAGGRYILLDPADTATSQASWSAILGKLSRLDIGSVMIEGGGTVINTLLAVSDESLIDSVVITIAPVWLGPQGTVVSPSHAAVEVRGAAPVARLQQPRWHQLGDDVILCGRLRT